MDKPATEGDKLSLVPKGGSSKLALTVSRRALLSGGNDQLFREMVTNLVTISLNMESVRSALGARISVTGPQYSILVAIHRMRHGEAVRVGDVAAYLHVSAAFVTVEAGKLAQRGLVRKQPSASDGRSRLLCLTRQGEARLERLTPDIRQVNDRLFASLDRSDFAALSRIARELVKDSKRALEFLSSAAPDRTDTFAETRPRRRLWL
jgi:MarR family transcriptional regulator, organic hydroperoxide resistance regulator